MHRRNLLTSMAIAASLTGLALSGCSATPEAAPKVASIAPPGSVPGGSGGSGESADAEPLSAEEQAQALRDFAKCMREHGVDMPDPEVQGGGDGGAVVFSAAVSADGGEAGGPPGTSVMDDAQKACQPLMEKLGPNGMGPKLDPAEEAKMREHALAFAKCMREHGVDMPDPQFEDGGGVTMKIDGDGATGLNPAEPAFQEAQKACEPELGLPEGAQRVGPGGAVAVPGGPGAAGGVVVHGDSSGGAPSEAK